MELPETLLKRNGHTALKTENAKDGLKLARERKPDLVLMDILRPDMDGLEAAKQLRADESTRALKVIVLSSFREKYSEADILACGANGFLSKPYHHQDFLNTVHTVLRLTQK